jgi:8-oxo-dGTP pyrophosphatase MutT (NUDIX family)
VGISKIIRTAPEAAIAEAKEEVGLEVSLWKGNQLFEYENKKLCLSSCTSSTQCAFYFCGSSPRRSRVFATTETMDIVEPDGREKSGGCFWLTKEELLAHPELEERIKKYALKALETLAP